MISLNPKEMSVQDNYKFLIGSIIPRPIAVITTLSDNNVLNIAPFSFFNVVSEQPPIISVSIQRENGRIKDTAKNILARQEAVVHIAEESYIEDINQTSISLPRDESELTQTSFSTIPAKTIAVPLLNELNVKMETQLYQHMPIEDDNQIVTDLLLLKVTQYHITEELYHNGRISDDLWTPMSRLAGNVYGKIGEKKTIESPK